MATAEGAGGEAVTGEEMERAIEFLLQNQAALEERITRTQQQVADLADVVRV